MAGFLVLPALGLEAIEGETVSISVRSAQLRKEPSHLAPVRASLAYTDQVEVLEVQGDFYRVSSQAGKGWLHKSAISEEKIVLLGDGEDVERAARDDEVALAGRGFNEQVEEQYKSEEGLEFDGVDRMESREPEEDTLREFIQAGNLRIPEGS
ncbi:MAG: SH3 domain-containing protein [Spirochaetales bacterium]|nr:SH3 domain-containing protein [Spirochaetales bacterium]MCF7939617.1 SH3 domain-containing protein [Spirochaetales bacterium]